MNHYLLDANGKYLTDANGTRLVSPESVPTCYVWVANESGDNLTPFMLDGTELSTVASEVKPVGLLAVLDPTYTQLVWAVCHSTGGWTIDRIAAATGSNTGIAELPLTTLTGSGDEGFGLAEFAAIGAVSGEIWLAPYTTFDTIARFGLDGTLLGTITDAGYAAAVGTPSGLCQVGSEVWITDWHKEIIHRFSDLGAYIGNIPHSGDLGAPVPICTVPDGNNTVWVGNYQHSGQSIIARFNPDTTPFAGGGLNPIASASKITGLVVVDSTVWVAFNDGFYADRILVLDFTGVLLHTYIGGSLFNPAAICQVCY